MTSATATHAPPAPAARPAAAVRALAGLCAFFAAAGGLTFLAAVLATQGAWYPGYVSEAGVAGQPYQPAYRLGTYGVAVALVLLAAVVALTTAPADRGSAPTGLGFDRRLGRVTAGVLLVSGLLAAVSGPVACSPGCPLPPFETPTPADLVHAGASVAGAALCALAILLLAFTRADTGLRLVSRVVLGPVVGLGLATAYGIAFVGRGHFTGTAERLMLLVIVAWCLAAAISLLGRPGALAGPRPTAE